MSDAFIDPVTRSYLGTDTPGEVALQRDPADGLANAVYLRIMTPLGSWWADPELGSRLHELEREKDVPRVQRLAREYALQALRPLLADGRAARIDVVTERQPGRLALRVEIADAAQVTQVFELFVKVA